MWAFAHIDAPGMFVTGVLGAAKAPSLTRGGSNSRDSAKGYIGRLNRVVLAGLSVIHGEAGMTREVAAYGLQMLHRLVSLSAPP